MCRATNSLLYEQGKVGGEVLETGTGLNWLVHKDEKNKS